MKPETGFVNFYVCPCGCEWRDEWSCACDDKCPDCNAACEPVASADAGDDYDIACAELEAQGLTRSDAQGIVDARLRHAAP